MSTAPVQAKLIQFNAFTNLPTIFFKIIGVTAFISSDEHISVVNKCLRIVLFTVTFLNCFWCWLGEIAYFTFKYSESNFVDLTIIVLCIGFLFLSFAKVGTILWKNRELNELMLELETIFPQTSDAQISYETAKYAAHAKRLMQIYSWLQMVMVWLFSLQPLTDTVIAYARRHVWELDFPYLIWYPFDPYGRGWFELNYFSQMWGAFFAATGILATDLLLTGIVLQICMHYGRLTRWLAEYRPNGKSNSKKDYENLKYSVQLHNEILRMSATVDDIFGVCILLNLVSSIVIVCVVGFLVVTSDLSVDLIKYVLTLITLSGQIFMVCLVGEMFIDSSTGVADGAWNGKWLLGDSRYRRGIMLIICRGRRPQCLMAYKFSVASMEMFSRVMSKSWQFFAILRSVYEK